MVKIAFDDSPAPLPSQQDAPSVRLSDLAAQKILRLLEKEPSGTFLRIRIDGGGCSGYAYQFKLDSTSHADDISIENGAAKVLVDAKSFQLIKGATIDYEDTLAASQFIIKNPNAKTSCGCGNSFSL